MSDLDLYFECARAAASRPGPCGCLARCATAYEHKLKRIHANGPRGREVLFPEVHALLCGGGVRCRCGFHTDDQEQYRWWVAFPELAWGERGETMAEKDNETPRRVIVTTAAATDPPPAMAEIFERDPDDPGPPPEATEEEILVYQPRLRKAASVLPKMFTSEAEAIAWAQAHWPLALVAGHDPVEHGKAIWAEQQRQGRAVVGVSDKPVLSVAEIRFPAELTSAEVTFGLASGPIVLEGPKDDPFFVPDFFRCSGCGYVGDRFAYDSNPKQLSAIEPKLLAVKPFCAHQEPTASGFCPDCETDVRLPIADIFGCARTGEPGAEYCMRCKSYDVRGIAEDERNKEMVARVSAFLLSPGERRSLAQELLSEYAFLDALATRGTVQGFVLSEEEAHRLYRLFRKVDEANG